MPCLGLVTRKFKYLVSALLRGKLRSRTNACLMQETANSKELIVAKLTIKTTRTVEKHFPISLHRRGTTCCVCHQGATNWKCALVWRFRLDRDIFPPPQMEHTHVFARPQSRPGRPLATHNFHGIGLILLTPGPLLVEFAAACSRTALTKKMTDHTSFFHFSVGLMWRD